MTPEYQQRLEQMFNEAFTADEQPMKDFAELLMELKLLRAANEKGWAHRDCPVCGASCIVEGLNHEV